MRHTRDLRSADGDPHQESGQVTFLFVFSSIALVFLLAFIINTARQTSRKVEMQGAADAGAVAGATWMARGMNLMVFDNKGMADLLAVMIDVHAVYQTAMAMPAVCAAAAAAVGWFAPEISAQLIREGIFWGTTMASNAGTVDQFLSGSPGVGWVSMRALDVLNQVIKTTIPLYTEAQVLEYSQKNGAGLAFMVSGGGIPPPIFPVGRGGKEYLARQADNCCLGLLTGPTAAAVGLICEAAVAPCLSALLAYPVFMGAIRANVSSLEGGMPSGGGSISVGEIGGPLQDQINKINQANQGTQGYTPIDISDLGDVSYSLFGPLQWPSNPPYPMILTDQPSWDPAAEVDYLQPVDILVVQRLLQFLVLSRSPMDTYGIIGGNQFYNPTWLGWITYAEADVYNPVDWGVQWGLFSQFWRAKLARATLVDYAFGQLLERANLPSGGDPGDFMDYVNTH